MILHVPGTRFSLTVIKSILCSTFLPQSVGQYALQWCAHCICHAFGLAKHMIMWLCNTTVRLLLINLFSETYLFFIFAYNESLNTLFLCPIWKRGDILFCTHLMVVQSVDQVLSAQYLLTRCQYWYSSRSVLIDFQVESQGQTAGLYIQSKCCLVWAWKFQQNPWLHKAVPASIITWVFTT